ncbi:hypothetical protein G6F24_014806 [Rhizopus arrhizus]|nr:hypothetical protein G6F24_014806 [Rhizopus arrhizus]
MLAEDLGDPIALQLTGNQYTEYRAQQLAAGAHGKTLNNRLGYLRAVYNELHQLGEIDYANPLQRVKLLKLQERELTWLAEEQIRTLFKAIRKRYHKDLYHPPRRPSIPRVAPHLRVALHDEWREYPDATEDPGAYVAGDDDALCTPVAGSPAGCGEAQSDTGSFGALGLSRR